MGEPRQIKREAFDRWLAAHDAEVRRQAAEEAWDEGYREANEDLWREGGSDGNPHKKAEG